MRRFGIDNMISAEIKLGIKRVGKRYCGKITLIETGYNYKIYFIERLNCFIEAGYLISKPYVLIANDLVYLDKMLPYFQDYSLEDFVYIMLRARMSSMRIR